MRLLTILNNIGTSQLFNLARNRDIQISGYDSKKEVISKVIGSFIDKERFQLDFNDFFPERNALLSELMRYGNQVDPHVLSLVAEKVSLSHPPEKVQEARRFLIEQGILIRSEENSGAYVIPLEMNQIVEVHEMSFCLDFEQGIKNRVFKEYHRDFDFFPSLIIFITEIIKDPFKLNKGGEIPLRQKDKFAQLFENESGGGELAQEIPTILLKISLNLSFLTLTQEGQLKGNIVRLRAFLAQPMGTILKGILPAFLENQHIARVGEKIFNTLLKNENLFVSLESLFIETQGKKGNGPIENTFSVGLFSETLVAFYFKLGFITLFKKDDWIAGIGVSPFWERYFGTPQVKKQILKKNPVIQNNFEVFIPRNLHPWPLFKTLMVVELKRAEGLFTGILGKEGLQKAFNSGFPKSVLHKILLSYCEVSSDSTRHILVEWLNELVKIQLLRVHLVKITTRGLFAELQELPELKRMKIKLIRSKKMMMVPEKILQDFFQILSKYGYFVGNRINII